MRFWMIALLICALSSSCGAGYAQEKVTAVIGGQSDLSVLSKAIGSNVTRITLADDGPFTIFAPVDSAWNELRSPSSTELLSLPFRSMLISTLQNHIVLGKCPLAELCKQPSRLWSVGGTELIFREVNGRLYINEAQVIDKPITAANGVIYKIDRVLMSPGFELLKHRQ